MGFIWTAQPGPDASVDAGELDALGLGQEFDSQQLAEAWLGQCYPELADAGIVSVSLFHDGELVYGPMGLDEQ